MFANSGQTDMLKVSGETLRDPNVYRRFFDAVRREMGLGR